MGLIDEKTEEIVGKVLDELFVKADMNAIQEKRALRNGKGIDGINMNIYHYLGLRKFESGLF